MADRLRIDVGGGRYTVVQPEDAQAHILRYGEPWLGQDNEGFAGSNCVLAMAYELKELRTKAGETLSNKQLDEARLMHRNLPKTMTVGGIGVADVIEGLVKEVERLYKLPAGQQAEKAADTCQHDFRYVGTDYHGSHKGEDAYKCTKCPAREYRP